MECSYAHTFSEKHICTRGTHYHSHTSFKDDQFCTRALSHRVMSLGFKNNFCDDGRNRTVTPFRTSHSVALQGSMCLLWQRSGTSAPTPTLHHSHWKHHCTSGRVDYHSQSPQLSLHIEKLQHYKNCTISLLSSALRLTPQTCFIKLNSQTYTNTLSLKFH